MIKTETLRAPGTLLGAFPRCITTTLRVVLADVDGSWGMAEVEFLTKWIRRVVKMNIKVPHYQ